MAETEIKIEDTRTTMWELFSDQHGIITSTGDVNVAGTCIIALDSGFLMVQGGVHTTLSSATAINFHRGRIDVEAGGEVFGHANGIRLETSGYVGNSGTISSLARAILGTENLRVVNSGMIDGGKIGIQTLDAGGIISSITLDNSGTIKGSDAAIRGGGGSDSIMNTGRIEGGIFLQDGNDSYQGGTGSVTGVIDLGEGNDAAFGGVGNETFYGAGGNDVIYGGGGTDTVIYTGGNNLAVNLGTFAEQDTGQGKDILRDIENIWSGNGSDTLLGNVYANSISGNGGNDIIRTSEGNDVLNGGFGNDLLEGGTGIDTAVFSEGTLAANVNLSLADSQETGFGLDKLISIENLSGGGGGDTFTGNASANVFTGGGGDDTLDGGAGDDTAVFSGTKADYTITTNADGMTRVSYRHLGGDGTDQLKNIRFAKFSDQIVELPNAAPANIQLTQSAIAENTGVNTIVSKLSAHDPEGDTVSFSLVSNPGGLFRLNGADLILTKALDYETQTTHEIVVKATDATGATRTETFTIKVTDVGEMVPSTPTTPTQTTPGASLVLYGTSKADVLTGATGNDMLWGLGSNDRLRGEAGNDKLHGGEGKDKLWGGTGQDIFVFDKRPNKKTNVDKIVDFNVADDTIHLAKSVFTKIGKKGVLKKSAFHAGSEAHDANDRIIFKMKTGALFYDKDGNGDAAQIQIGTLTKNLKGLSHGDFLIT